MLILILNEYQLAYKNLQRKGTGIPLPLPISYFFFLLAAAFECLMILR